MSMAEQQAEAENEIQISLPPTEALTAWRILLEPVNHGFASAEREALKRGVPAHMMVELLLNHLASVVAMIEPAGAREATVTQLVKDFAPMVRRHVDARMTSPGGVILPRAS
jgi:hypothetical protein